LASGATASSRSRITTSQSSERALSIALRFEAGIYSALRRARALIAEAKEQKFFGSFFQKRTFFRA
jgi:hypothetical protein